jgi:hypothetical protein
MVARLALLGLTPRNTVALEVPGRWQSGRLRRTSLVVAEHQSSRYLVSLAGESEWVRNVRANNCRASLRRLRSRPARLVELPVAERPAVLKAYLPWRVPGHRRCTRPCRPVAMHLGVLGRVRHL